jgi:hypothetical protein
VKIPAPTLLTCFLAFAGQAVAEVPKKAPISRYTKLWTDSPFTTKPVVTGEIAAENPLNDYALIGVSSLGGEKYRVTMLNKKKPDEPRIYLESGTEVGGFKIIKVNRKNGNPLATTVQVQSGSMTGTISVDEKLLTLAAPPAKAAPGGNPNNPNGTPPGGIPGQNPPGGQGRVPQIRPRVVPVPNPNGAQPNQPEQAVPAPQLNQNPNPPGNTQGGNNNQGGNNQGRQNQGDRTSRRPR